MIFKKITKAAAALLARPEQSPLDQSSHHQVCENQLRSTRAISLDLVERMSCTLEMHHANVQKLMEVWLHFARPELPCSTGRATFRNVILSFWTALATLARANSGRVGQLWLLWACSCGLAHDVSLLWALGV